jgi:hypothetical protein
VRERASELLLWSVSKPASNTLKSVAAEAQHVRTVFLLLFDTKRPNSLIVDFFAGCCYVHVLLWLSSVHLSSKRPQKRLLCCQAMKEVFPSLVDPLDVELPHFLYHILVIRV